MEVTFLGTGGAFTDFRVNYHNNLLINCGPVSTTDPAEKYLLIDCGATAVQSIKELGIKPWEVHGVIVTHMHGDHIGGIEQLLWERYYTGPSGPGFRKTAIYSTPEILEALRASLSPCVNEYTDNTGEARPGGYHALVDEYVTEPYDDREFTWVVGDAAFRFHVTPHVVSHLVNKPAYGIELLDRHPDRQWQPAPPSVYYTSDTTFRPGIGDLFPESRIIFHDCTFSPKYPGTVHTHYEELLTLPDEVRARIILMHHTEVPVGVNVLGDGFMGAALRHESFDL